MEVVLLFAQQTMVQRAFFAVFGFGSLLLMLFWVWMAIDCLRNEPPGPMKTAWLLALLFGSWIGAIFYFLIRRGQRIREARDNAPIPLSPALSPQAAALMNKPPIQPLPAERPPIAAPPQHAYAPPPASSSGWSGGQLLVFLFAVVLAPCLLTAVLGFGFFIWGMRQVNEAAADPLWTAPPEVGAPAWEPMEMDFKSHEEMMAELQQAQAEALKNFEQAQTEFEKSQAEAEKLQAEAKRLLEESSLAFPPP